MTNESNGIQELCDGECKSIVGSYWLDEPKSEFGKTLNDIGNLGVDFGSWLYDVTH